MLRRTVSASQMVMATASSLPPEPKWHARVPNLILPTWVDATNPVDISACIVDASQFQGKLIKTKMDVDDPNSVPVLHEQVAVDLGGRMQEVYKKYGLVYVRNTGLTDLDEMRQVGKLVMKNEQIYKGGSNNRSHVGKSKVYDVGAPLSAWLQYHHEMTYIENSVDMLGFLCAKAPPAHRAVKGATFLSNAAQSTEWILKTELGQKLKDKGVCFWRDMTDREHFTGRIEEGVYNHWQKSMLTDDADEAVRVALSKGLKTEWGPNRLLKTKFYADAFEYCPYTDKNVLFSSLADDGMWFDSWPLVQHLPYSQRPLKLTYGDDQPFTMDEKRTFIEAYDRFGVPVPWQPGEVALVCNYRWAHGRPAVELEEGEERQLGVMIGEPIKRVGQAQGKW